MRIAFSGSHRTGKSTLLERVAEHLPRHVTVDEPYHLLEEDGHDFADPPSLDDFVAQLERALEAFDDVAPDAVFDRTPADVVAYLLTHEEAGEFDRERWIDHVRDALQSLDLLVFVPIETPDRIPVPAHEDRAWRIAVHEQLVELLIEDALELDGSPEILRVHGDLEQRVRQVLARVARR